MGREVRGNCTGIRMEMRRRFRPISSAFWAQYGVRKYLWTIVMDYNGHQPPSTTQVHNCELFKPDRGGRQRFHLRCWGLKEGPLIPNFKRTNEGIKSHLAASDLMLMLMLMQMQMQRQMQSSVLESLGIDMLLRFPPLHVPHLPHCLICLICLICPTHRSYLLSFTYIPWPNHENNDDAPVAPIPYFSTSPLLLDSFSSYARIFPQDFRLSPWPCSIK